MLVFLFGLFPFPYLNSCDKHDFFFLMRLFTYLGGGSRGVYITITYFANCDQIRIKIHNFQKLGLLLFCLSVNRIKSAKIIRMELNRKMDRIFCTYYTVRWITGIPCVMPHVLCAIIHLKLMFGLQAPPWGPGRRRGHVRLLQLQLLWWPSTQTLESFGESKLITSGQSESFFPREKCLMQSKSLGS